MGKCINNIFFMESIAKSDVARQVSGVKVWIFVCSLISVLVLGIIIGFLIGKGHTLKNFPETLSKAFVNIDNYIIVIAVMLLIFSVGLSVTEKESTLAIVILNVFSSVIFSWLLTKKTSIKDFKEKEEELALRSYRHINYIESAANTASGTIDKYALEHKKDITPELLTQLFIFLLQFSGCVPMCILLSPPCSHKEQSPLLTEIPSPPAHHVKCCKNILYL